MILEVCVVQVLQQQHQNQVSKLEIKFCRVVEACTDLKGGVSKREDSSKRIRITTEGLINQYFNM